MAEEEASRRWEEGGMGGAEYGRMGAGEQGRRTRTQNNGENFWEGQSCDWLTFGKGGRREG